MNAKALVRRSFARAAESYDQAAVFQRDCGERLFAALTPAPAPRRVLDIGCGTGHGAALLQGRWPGAQCVALDFAIDMLRRVPDKAARLCADAEALPVASASTDLVWSNLTLQWCDPSRFASEAARVLRPGGRVAVSTLGPGTFAELRRAFAVADAYRHTAAFHGAERLRAAFTAAGLRITQLRVVPLVLHYPDLGSLLAEVREVGANRVTGGNRRVGLMGKATWRRFAEQYEALRAAQGLPLSYETLLIHASK